MGSRHGGGGGYPSVESRYILSLSLFLSLSLSLSLIDMLKRPIWGLAHSIHAPCIHTYMSHGRKRRLRRWRERSGERGGVEGGQSLFYKKQ
jgi:hypothetical protein